MGKAYSCAFITQCLTAACLVIIGCGPSTQKTQKQSNLNWVQSRPHSPQFAYLEERDLADRFLLGVSVIGVDDFFSSALNMKIPPQSVRLKLVDEGSRKKLAIIETKKNKEILRFDLQEQNGELEIDFASAGNDLNFRQYLEKTGGMFTSAKTSGLWVSRDKPVVQSISQDPNTLVVDLKHRVQQAYAQRRRAPRLDSRQGEGSVLIRMFLVRENSLPRFDHTPTVGEGKSFNIGFFSPNHRLIGTKAELSTPIQRFFIEPQKKIRFYLKDFPSEYIQTAEKAILSWNKAFDGDPLEVKIAPAHIDVGDPRYHVIKWFDGTDRSLGWAGVAKMIVNPETGLVLSGSIYIQGNTLENLYKDIMSYSMSVSQHQGDHLEGGIGDLSFEADIGETPVIPFLVDTKKGFEEYMKGYYLETIAHEVGHVLGLRHNFAGSSFLSPEGGSSSVMDYLPRSQRSEYKGPGHYDIEAIRWGYYNQTPDVDPLEFCTDEHVWKLWYCMKGDYGDPVDYTIKGLLDSVSLLRSSPVVVDKPSQISSIGGLIEKAHKLWKLRDDVPSDYHSRVNVDLPAAYRLLFEAEPAESVEMLDRSTVAKNLELMKKIAKKKRKLLAKQGLI